MTLFISVNRAVLANNAKNQALNPPFEIRLSPDDKNPLRVLSAEYTGTIRLVYIPGTPLVSGAVCWVEIDPTTTG